MSRDLASERELLTEAGGELYAEAVAARLDERESEWGNSFAWGSEAAAWDELVQQAIDLGARAALALRRAELDGTPPRELVRLRALLTAVARCGAQADVLIGEARRLVGPIGPSAECAA